MLAAYLDINPRPPAPSASATATATANANTATNTGTKAPKPPRAPKPAKAASQGASKGASKGGKKHAPAVVEGYDAGGSVHARFSSPAEGPEPQGMMGACVAECEPVVEEEATDPYEYLWQEANHGACTEDEDTDSCATFADDAVSDVTDTLSTSPGEAPFDTATFLTRRKARASEVPVYSGPELWFEDDDFIE